MAADVLAMQGARASAAVFFFWNILTSAPKWLKQFGAKAGPPVYEFWGPISPYSRIYASMNKVSIDSDNGLSPAHHQAIIWTSTGLLWIGPLEMNFSEIPMGVGGDELICQGISSKHSIDLAIVIAYMEYSTLSACTRKVDISIW